MSWRIVYVTEANKLSLNLNSLQIIQEDEKYFISLTEIALLVVEDYTSVITTRLLIEMANTGIPILILGLNKMPIGEYMPISDNVRTSKKIIEQCKWSDNIKNQLWKKIIEGKIKNQIITLKRLGKESKTYILEDNISKMQDGDKTNMEGISARTYFKELFDDNFLRFNKDLENACLNFTYHIVRTIISKEIIARGYNTTIGINHKSQYNVFNLSDDLIEVFRPIVDYYVYELVFEDDRFKNEYTMTKELRIELLNLVNRNVEFGGKVFSILNVVPYYVANVIKYIDEEGKSEYIYPRLL